MTGGLCGRGPDGSLSARADPIGPSEGDRDPWGDDHWGGFTKVGSCILFDLLFDLTLDASALVGIGEARGTACVAVVAVVAVAVGGVAVAVGGVASDVLVATAFVTSEASPLSLQLRVPSASLRVPSDRRSDRVDRVDPDECDRSIAN